MEIQVSLKDWKLKENEGMRKIVGTFVIKAGAAEIAEQNFNDGYSCTTIIFSAELTLDVEKLTKRIESEIIKNFTGKEE